MKFIPSFIATAAAVAAAAFATLGSSSSLIQAADFTCGSSPACVTTPTAVVLLLDISGSSDSSHMASTLAEFSKNVFCQYPTGSQFSVVVFSSKFIKRIIDFQPRDAAAWGQEIESKWDPVIFTVGGSSTTLEGLSLAGKVLQASGSHNALAKEVLLVSDSHPYPAKNVGDEPETGSDANLAEIIYDAVDDSSSNQGNPNGCTTRSVSSGPCAKTTSMEYFQTQIPNQIRDLKAAGVTVKVLIEKSSIETDNIGAYQYWTGGERQNFACKAKERQLGNFCWPAFVDFTCGCAFVGEILPPQDVRVCDSAWTWKSYVNDFRLLHGCAATPIENL